MMSLQKTPYIEINLPQEIETKLFDLMKVMNPEFGAIDLVKTPNEELVFLEVNPSGRWLWIQELTGMNIAKDIAYYLASN